MGVQSRVVAEAMQVWMGLQRGSVTRRVWGQWRILNGQHKAHTAQGPWPTLRTLSTTSLSSNKAKEPKPAANDGEDPHAEEQEREHVFTPMRERDMMERLDSHSHQMSLDSVSANCMAATDVTASECMGQYDGHNSTGGVSLSGVMQSNVPEPFRSTERGTPTHMNMPGGGSTRADKYLAGHIKDVHPSRQFSTSATAPCSKQSEKSDNLFTPFSDMQGPQGSIDKTVEQTLHLEDPCPQGVQGQDCEHFKIWLNNCVRYGLTGCEDNLKAFRLGRKTLPDIFAEQEKMIQMAAEQYPASSSAGGPKDDVSVSKKLSQKDKLKRAVKEYGGTVVVFHIAISLMSLGTAYLAVSSGLDVVGILERLGVGKTILESRLATGTGTFVVAYAVHKVFAPVRIATTLTATPFIVRYLRRISFLKPPKVN